MAEFVRGIQVTSAESRKLLSEARKLALAAAAPTDNIILEDIKRKQAIRAAVLKIQALQEELNSRRN